MRPCAARGRLARMELERLIAALAPSEVVGAALRRDARPRVRRARRRARRAVLLRPRRARRRPRLRRRGGRARRGRARRRARRSSSTCRSSSSRDARRRWPSPQTRSSATRRRARGRRRHRHERQDDDGVPAPRDPRGGRPRPGLLGTVESARRRRAQPGGAHDARGDRPPAHVPRDARRRRPQLRDGGDLARLGAAAGSTAFASPRSCSRT